MQLCRQVSYEWTLITVALPAGRARRPNGTDAGAILPECYRRLRSCRLLREGRAGAAGAQRHEDGDQRQRPRRWLVRTATTGPPGYCTCNL